MTKFSKKKDLSINIKKPENFNNKNKNYALKTEPVINAFAEAHILSGIIISSLGGICLLANYVTEKTYSFTLTYPAFAYSLVGLGLLCASAPAIKNIKNSIEKHRENKQEKLF